MFVNLDRLIARARSLEPLPASATALAGELSKPDWRIEAVVRIIELDPALTGRLLQFANSAASWSMTKIGTVRQATTRLGAGTVLQVAVACAVQKRLMQSVPELEIAEGEVWRHSVAAAVAVEALRPVCRVPAPPESFTAALLHDVGKLVLAQELRSDAIEVLKRTRIQDGLTIEQAEAKVLEITHADVGGIVCEHWGLPHGIVQGVTHHHNPSAAPQQHISICRIVQLADWAAKVAGAGLGAMTPSRDDYAASLAALELSDQQFDLLTAEVQLRLTAALAAYDE
jgi:HD-like signal output (HDOD) protein